MVMSFSLKRWCFEHEPFCEHHFFLETYPLVIQHVKFVCCSSRAKGELRVICRNRSSSWGRYRWCKWGQRWERKAVTTRVWTIPVLLVLPNSHLQRSVPYVSIKNSTTNALHPNINIHILYTLLNTFPLVLTKRICSTIRMEIIFFILIILVNYSAVLLLGEFRCWSLWGVKGKMMRLAFWQMTEFHQDKSSRGQVPCRTID